MAPQLNLSQVAQSGTDCLTAQVPGATSSVSSQPSTLNGIALIVLWRASSDKKVNCRVKDRARHRKKREKNQSENPKVLRLLIKNRRSRWAEVCFRSYPAHLLRCDGGFIAVTFYLMTFRADGVGHRGMEKILQLFTTVSFELVSFFSLTLSPLAFPPHLSLYPLILIRTLSSGMPPPLLVQQSLHTKQASVCVCADP